MGETKAPTMSRGTLCEAVTEIGGIYGKGDHEARAV